MGEQYSWRPTYALRWINTGCGTLAEKKVLQQRWEGFPTDSDCFLGQYHTSTEWRDIPNVIGE